MPSVSVRLCPLPSVSRAWAGAGKPAWQSNKPLLFPQMAGETAHPTPGSPGPLHASSMRMNELNCPLTTVMLTPSSLCEEKMSGRFHVICLLVCIRWRVCFWGGTQIGAQYAFIYSPLSHFLLVLSLTPSWSVRKPSFCEAGWHNPWHYCHEWKQAFVCETLVPAVRESCWDWPNNANLILKLEIHYRYLKFVLKIVMGLCKKKKKIIKN